MKKKCRDKKIRLEKVSTSFMLIDQGRALRKDCSADSRHQLPAAVDRNQYNERGRGILFNSMFLSCNVFQK